MTRSGGQSPAEQHLGDRLAALVDGELGHDARERVLAHLATCCKCKAEADAQRRLKNVFAQTAPPAPSEGFLARLQGLPGLSADDGDGGGGEGSPFGGSSVFGVRDTRGVQGVHEAREQAFAFLPTGRAVSPAASSAATPRERGFRIHEVGRPAPRRRLAFAAAGAVSLAAFALGGALPLDAAVDSPGSQAEGSDSAVSPVGASSVVEETEVMGVRERTRREVGLLDMAAPADTTSPGTTHARTLSEVSGGIPDPLIQPILAATRLLRAAAATPAPTQMANPSQPATRTPPYHGFSAPPK
ncbi:MULTISPECIES: zf-HC2 domain-containing protein [unclassified Streptomyces]|uniref:anti-sigma factor family protein n=1 Tax=unclassified Streptomyces TaxID=2593676 RepID=UPI00336A6E1A